MLPLSTGARALGTVCVFLWMKEVISHLPDELLSGIEGRDLLSRGGEIRDRQPILARHKRSASGGFQRRGIRPVAGCPPLAQVEQVGPTTLTHQRSCQLQDLLQPVGVSVVRARYLVVSRLRHTLAFTIVIEVVSDLLHQFLRGTEISDLFAFPKELLVLRCALSEHEPSTGRDFEASHHVTIAVGPAHQAGSNFRPPHCQAIVPA